MTIKVSRRYKFALGMFVLPILHMNARGGRTEISTVVSIKRGASLGDICAQAKTPCLIEGEPPAATKDYPPQRVGLVVDEWISKTNFNWFLENGVIRVFPRSGLLMLKNTLNKRIDIDIHDIPSDEALLAVFHAANVRAGINHNGSALVGQRLPSISIHARQIPIHEALVRILKQDPPLGIKIIELPNSSIELTLSTYAKIKK
jgi:hypothetical protein